ncbi:hypothetical protein HPB48_010939 [Haemaphysalis longicornis]|uniref:Uncharacterized protein n=1 Tax=Haemaphysalis longicornis TaxID=44386 RepID=A0A9J6GMD1_HAELO|nr:hypothetical protein HPB48_010939 [Haemaphysalis longicornis]
MDSDSKGEDSRDDRMTSSREWYRIDPEEDFCAVPRSERYHTDGSITSHQVKYRGIVHYLHGN